MKPETWQKVRELAQTAENILVATAGPESQPHIAFARKIEFLSGGRVTVTEWFCPGTIQNLVSNPRVTIVLWNSRKDAGFQLMGEMRKVEEVAVLDGYGAEEAEQQQPQVERQFVVMIKRIMDFKKAPHSDEEM